MGLYSQWLAKVTASQNQKEESPPPGECPDTTAGATGHPVQLDWVTLLQTADQAAPGQRLTAQVIPFPRVGRFADPT